jgi:membrane protein
MKHYPIGGLLKRVGRAVMADHILTIAGSVAYNFFFSLFPLLLFAAPILALVGNKQQMIDWIMARLASGIPPEAFAPVRTVVQDVVFAPNAPALVSLGAVMTLYSASNIFSTLMTALNIAYHVREDSRRWWRQVLIQFGMVLVVGLLVIVAATVMLAGPNIVNTVVSAVGLGSTAKWIWMVVQYPIAFAFLVFALWLIYYVLPDVKQDKRQLLIGAVIAAILWVVATLAFRAYVTDFNKFNKAYGTIGAVLLLLTWMYYSSVVILVGGELNYALAEPQDIERPAESKVGKKGEKTPAA